MFMRGSHSHVLIRRGIFETDNFLDRNSTDLLPDGILISVHQALITRTRRVSSKNPHSPASLTIHPSIRVKVSILNAR